jgi:hypothetical protein
MSARDDDAESRQEARAAWPVRKVALGHEPPDDLRKTTTPEERLAMVDTLTTELWELAGQSGAPYTREQTPISRRPWPATPSSDGR